jgi:hypothetical protein
MREVPVPETIPVLVSHNKHTTHTHVPVQISLEEKNKHEIYITGDIKRKYKKDISVPVKFSLLYISMMLVTFIMVRYFKDDEYTAPILILTDTFC